MFRNLKRNRRGGSQQQSSKSIRANSDSAASSSSFHGDTADDGRMMNPMVVVVDQISKDDVLVGKKNNHPGTLRLQGIVTSFAVEYDGASRGDKKLLSERVVREIQEHGGRFLRPLDDNDGNKWEEISNFEAAEKISNHFRNLRRKER